MRTSTRWPDGASTGDTVVSIHTQPPWQRCMRCSPTPPRSSRRAAAKASRSATWQSSRALVPGVRQGSWPRMWRAAPDANSTVP